MWLYCWTLGKRLAKKTNEINGNNNNYAYSNYHYYYLSASPLMSTEGEIGNFLGNNFFHIFSLRLTLGVCSGTTYLHKSAHPVMWPLLLWLPQFWKPGEIQRTNFVSCGEYNHTYSTQTCDIVIYVHLHEAICTCITWSVLLNLIS